MQYNISPSELVKLKNNLTNKNWLTLADDESDLLTFDLAQENKNVEDQRLAKVAEAQAQVQQIDAQRDEFGELDWKLVLERNKILKELDRISWSALVQTKNNHIKALKKFVFLYNEKLKTITNEEELITKLISITVEGNNLFLNFNDDFEELTLNMRELHPNKALNFVQRFYETVN